MSEQFQHIHPDNAQFTDDGLIHMEHAVTRLTPTKPDSEVAAELRAELMPILKQVCDILDRARASGLNIGYSITPDQYGRHAAVIQIVKPL